MTMVSATLCRSHTWRSKEILGIASTPANWCVLRECAQEPLQFYWFRSAVKIWNRMVDSNSKTLCDVMKADIFLGNSGASNCWSRQMKNAFGDLQNGTVYRSDLLQCRKLNISNLRIDSRFRHQAVWREAHGQDPCSRLKKSVAYYNWFALPERPVSDARAPFVLPEYLKMALSKSVMRNVARFRIRGHGLKCGTGLYGKSPDRSARVCNLCENGDSRETRFFSCIGTEHLRHQFIHLFDNISEGDIKGFVFQHNSNLLVQLSIFLIYLFVGTYRLSSHARLEAFVIQTKLN